MFRLNRSFVLVLALLVCGAVQSFGQAPQPEVKKSEKELLDVLKSGASQKEKADACRQLSFVGSKEAVAGLAALLTDEKMSHMARYGLEAIPDPSVDEALRAALGKVKGRLLIGVIGSLGVRHDEKAVAPLLGLLKDTDAGVAQAAARAVGRIGTAEAAKGLQEALKSVSPENRVAFCEGAMRCAEARVAKKDPAPALAIYDQLRALPDVPHQVRTGAIRGAILTRGTEGIALLKETLHSGDYALVSVAVRVSMEMPDKAVTQALLAELNQLSAEGRILVVMALGRRGDASAAPALLELARASDKPLRLAAIRALPELGQVSAVPVLAGLMDEADPEISQTAQTALLGFPGPEVDAVVMGLFKSDQPQKRLTGIELMGRRRMVACVPDLVQAAGDANGDIRQAALKKVGELGRPDDFQKVLDLLMQTKEASDTNLATKALVDVCGRAEKPEGFSEKLTALLATAQPDKKNALLRLLGSIGGTVALNAVRGAAKDADAGVQDTAIRLIAAWKTKDAAPDMLALAKTSSNESHKIAALQGYLRLAREAGLPVEEKLAMCKEAAPLTQRDDEKRQILGVLQEIPSAEALAMVMSHLENPALQGEAGTAAVSVCEKIAGQNRKEVAEALQKVIPTLKSEDLKKKAEEIQNKVK
jgi:HEAT repeat protein